MRNLFVFFSSLFLLSNALALPEYDPFEDSVGSDLAGQTNLTGHTWNAVSTVTGASGNRPVITTGSLSYSGLPSSTSNSVYLASNGSAGQLARVPIGTSITNGSG